MKPFLPFIKKYIFTQTVAVTYREKTPLEECLSWQRENKYERKIYLKTKVSK